MTKKIIIIEGKSALLVGVDEVEASEELFPRYLLPTS
jgi:hypothetical protein